MKNMRKILTKINFFLLTAIVALPSFVQANPGFSTIENEKIVTSALKILPVKIKFRTDNFGKCENSVIHITRFINSFMLQLSRTSSISGSLKYAVWSKGAFF